MYISKVHIRNYKSITDVEIGADPKINIFVGKNGTGKTAFFDVVNNLIFQIDVGYKNLPDYVSVEISDSKKELGTLLYSLIKTNTPPGYLSFFKNEVLPTQKKDHFKIEFVGERINEQFFYYLKYNDIYFHDTCLFLDKKLLNSGNPIDIQEIKREDVQSAKTLSDFVSITTKNNRKINLKADLTSKAFDFLQRKTFIVGEMRDLKKKNTEREFDNQKGKNNNPSYQNFLNASIDPASFIDRIYNLQNTKEPTEHQVILDFKSKCKEDDYGVDAIRERVGKLSLRVYYPKKEILLDNTDFPSGLLQKIFLNFVLAISKDGILLFEEPENNLHPGLQKQIFHLLKERESQVFINTHSPEFIDNTLISNIYNFQIDEEGVTQVKSFDELESSESFRTYFDVDKRIFFADFVVLCEGYSEFVLLPYLFDEFTDEKEFFHNKNIFLFNIEGKDQRKRYTKILESFNISYFIILDKLNEKTDTGYTPDSKTYIHKFKDFDKCYDDTCLKRVSIEKSNELKKKKLALEVLSFCLTHNKKIGDFFKDDAKKEFENIVKSFRDEYENKNPNKPKSAKSRKIGKL